MGGGIGGGGGIAGEGRSHCAHEEDGARMGALPEEEESTLDVSGQDLADAAMEGGGGGDEGSGGGGDEGGGAHGRAEKPHAAGCRRGGSVRGRQAGVLRRRRRRGRGGGGAGSGGGARCGRGGREALAEGGWDGGTQGEGLSLSGTNHAGAVSTDGGRECRYCRPDGRGGAPQGDVVRNGHAEGHGALGLEQEGQDGEGEESWTGGVALLSPFGRGHECGGRHSVAAADPQVTLTSVEKAHQGDEAVQLGVAVEGLEDGRPAHAVEGVHEVNRHEAVVRVEIDVPRDEMDGSLDPPADPDAELARREKEGRKDRLELAHRRLGDEAADDLAHRDGPDLARLLGLGESDERAAAEQCGGGGRNGSGEEVVGEGGEVTAGGAVVQEEEAEVVN